MTKTTGAPADPSLPDPFAQRVRRFLLFALVTAMLVFTFVLYNARQGGRWPLAYVNSNTAATATPEATTTSTQTDTPSPSATSSQTSLPSLTATATRVPASPAPSALDSAFAAQGGAIFLSQYEGGYWRLYAYHPQNLPFTRLTDGAWDDITPAIHPSGETLAFASNRDGRWDLYTLDLTSGKTTRLTDSPEYEAAPSWSPDGQWLVYEAYTDTLTISTDPNDPSGRTITASLPNLEIFIRPLDNSQEPIRLTYDSAADYAPAWSPGGRQIAFVSDRSGESEIWLADLDSIDERFTDLSQDPRAANRYPAWSPDGLRLAWSSAQDGFSNLVVLDYAHPGAQPRLVGSGERPAWSPAGDVLLASLPAPNTTYLSGYLLDASGLLLPPVPLNGSLAGMSWGSASLPQPLASPFARSADLTPTPYWRAAISPADGVPSGRQRLIEIADVDAPYAFLQDMADEAYNALREELTAHIGWDYLSTLENAYVPLSSPLFPGMLDDWLYTGRAFALNPAPMNAGWMVVVRQDLGASTYWRVYLRSRFQDGSQGRPLVDFPWNFNARYSGDPRFYEQGGAPANALPQGYWIDFTELATAYGWQRLPALNTWRYAIPAARFNEFVLADGHDWFAAMREIYPVEALNTPTPVMPPTFTPTATRRPTRTLTPTRTPWPTRTPTSTRTVTPTRTPTRGPSATPTPP